MTFAPDEQAHHIVPSTHPRAQQARDILDRFGVDINNANNGVPLSLDIHYRSRLHSFDGIDRVTAILGRAGSREQVIEALRMIAARIRSRTLLPTR